MRQFGLIGYPLSHSFSKQYFTTKFEQEGLTDCFFELYSIQNIEEIESLINTTPNLKGLCVTIPHKVNVIDHLTDASNLPAPLQACNCIKIDGDKRIGFNTDAFGFEHSLLPLLKPQHKMALVLGNGGAAQAIKYVLSKLGIGYKLVGRRHNAEYDFSYEDLTKEIINQHKLIINTTPLGTFPNIDECAAIPYNAITPQHLLYDLVYNPTTTQFLKNGEMQGATIKNGYEMLVLQAEENWRIWNS
jgi:shikimate dehydrogenase